MARILVADDHDALRRGLALALSTAGHDVEEAANGNAALWTVTAVQPGSLKALDADAQRAAHDQARDRAAMSDANVYVTEMRENADVDVNPKLFE